MDIKDYLLDFYISQNGEKITPELAKSLVEEMAITDGSDRTSGEKWTPAETNDVGTKMGINFEQIPKCEWYLILNMMYSDYYSVGRKHGLIDYQFFGELAQAWFNDVDGPENKTFRYFFCA